MEDMAWDDIKLRVPLGTEVRGRIVASQPFGVFVDLGLGFLGLLEVFEFGDPDIRRMGEARFPEVGESIVARVLQHVESNRQLRLTQRDTSPEDWDRLRMMVGKATQS